MQIASLTVAMGVELHGFRRGLQAAVTDVERTVQSVRRAFSGLDFGRIPTQTFAQSGLSAGGAFTQNFRLSAGPVVFHAVGEQAGRSFARGLTASLRQAVATAVPAIARTVQRGFAAQNLAQQLPTRSFVQAGLQSGQALLNAFRRTLTPATFQQIGGQAALGFTQGFTATLAPGATRAATTFTQNFQRATPHQHFHGHGAAAGNAFSNGLVSGVSRGIGTISRLLGTIGVALGIREIVQYADAWTLAEGRIRLFTKSSDDAARVQQQLFEIAQENRQEFAETVTLFARLSLGSKELGRSQAELLTITRTVGQALRISNASTTEAISVQRQLSQALGSGRFQGDELRSIVENAPALAQAIADALGVTIAEMRKLGAEGKILPAQVAQAILDAKDRINDAAQGLPTTVGQAFVRLGNSVQKFIGETSKATGAAEGLVSMINAVGNAFDKNRPLVESLAFAIGVSGLTAALFSLTKAFIALPIAQTISSWFLLGGAMGPILPLTVALQIGFTNLWRAILGPIGIAIIAVTTITGLFYLWRKRAAEAREETEKLKGEIAGMSETQLQLEVTDALNDLRRLRATRLLLEAEWKKKTELGLSAFGVGRELQKVRDEIDETIKRHNLLIEALDQIAETKPAPPPKVSFDFEAFTKQGSRLLDLFDDLRDRAQAINADKISPFDAKGLADIRLQTVGVVNQLVKMFETTEQKLARIKDQTSDEAVALRKFAADIRSNVEALAAIRIAEARVRIPIVPEIQPPPIAETESSINRVLAPLGPLIGSQFGDAIGNAVAKRLQQMQRPKLAVIAEFQPPTEADFRTLQSQIDRLIAKHGLVDLAALTGDKAFETEALADFDHALQQTISTVRNLAEGIRAANLPLQVQLALLLRLAAIAGKIPKPVADTSNSLQKFVTAGRGLSQIASEFTNINKNVLRVVTSILDAVAAVEQFNKAKADKDVLGQISGALGVVGGVVSLGAAIGDALFGAAREVQREHNEILRRNSEEIAKLSLTLKGFQGTFGDQADLLRGLTALLGPAEALAAARPSQQLGQPDLTAVNRALEEFRRGVAATGFTMTELNEIAKQWDITLLDSQGRIIPEAVGQFVEAMKLARQAAFAFANTVDDVSLATRLRNAAAGVESSPQQIVSDALRELGTLAPQIIKDFFSGIDLSDGLSEAEVAEIRRQSQDLVDKFLSGALNPDDLRGFKSKEEFAAFILNWLDALNSMTEAANETTRSMINIPQGFKVERLRFESTLADTARAIEGTFAALDPSKTKKAKSFEEATSAARSINNGTVINGNVEIGITTDASESGDRALRKIAVALRGKARTLGPGRPIADAFDLF